MPDDEANRFSARASRYARLGANAGALAARMASNRVTGARDGDAQALARALGSLKGPLMKVAQMLATIPEALPAAYAEELIKLQSQAPPMGAAFVGRRMRAELGAEWRERFAEFELAPAAAASLGQVHRAVSLEGERLACKLQYPDMASTVEADLVQLDLLFALHRRMGPAVDTREIAREIGARVREELDYGREARLARLYRTMLAARPLVRVPGVFDALSTRRLLTMQWLDGAGLMEFQDAPAESRNTIAHGLVRRLVAAVLAVRRHSWRSAPWQLFRRLLGRGRGAAGRGGQSVRLRLRAHFSRRPSSAGSSNSIAA